MNGGRNDSGFDGNVNNGKHGNGHNLSQYGKYGNGRLLFLGVNANTWGSAQSVLEWTHDYLAKNSWFDEVSSFPDVCFLQETRLRPGQKASAVQWAQKRALQMSLHHGNITGDGPLAVSAGVAVAVSSNFASSNFQHEVISSNAARMVARRVNIGLSVPITFLCAYLIDGIK